MSPWLEATVPFVIAVVVVIGPGLLVGSAAGARSWHRWALAAPITFTAAGVGAIVLALVGLPYTVTTFAGTVLVIAIAAWAIRYAARRRGAAWSTSAGSRQSERAPEAPRWARPAAIAAGVLIAVSTISARLLGGIGSPTAIAQLFDNVFHLNAIGLVHSSGNGSSLTLGNLTEASRGFYPAGFHDVVALVVGLGVDDVSVALNVVSILLASAVWPISLMFLTTRLFGNRAEIIVMTGVCAGLFAAFPYRLFSFGVLYPFMAGLTMLPVLIALVIEFFRTNPSTPSARLVPLAALAATVPGIALTHPSVVVAGLVLGTPYVVASAFRVISARADGDGAKLHTTLAVAYVVGTIVVFLLVRPPLSTAPWDPIQDPRAAVGSIFLMSPGTGLIGWALIPLFAVGAVHAVRRLRQFGGILATAAIGAVLYFASAAMWHPLVRDILAGVWYRDTERVSALFAIACLPLVILGAATIVRGAARGLRRVVPRSTSGVRTLSALIVVAVMIVAVGQRGALAQAQTWLGQSFGQAGVEPLLSEDERALLEELPDIVPADEVVLGDPSTGASLTPAFSDREALAPHIFGERSPQERLLLNRWDRAGVDPAVCDVVHELHAYWALDFGTDGVLGSDRPEIYGLDQLEGAPGIIEVARVGDAILYEAVACR